MTISFEVLLGLSVLGLVIIVTILLKSLRESYSQQVSTTRDMVSTLSEVSHTIQSTVATIQKLETLQEKTKETIILHLKESEARVLATIDRLERKGDEGNHTHIHGGQNVLGKNEGGQTQKD